MGRHERMIWLAIWILCTFTLVTPVATAETGAAGAVLEAPEHAVSSRAVQSSSARTFLFIRFFLLSILYIFDG